MPAAETIAPDTATTRRRGTATLTRTRTRATSPAPPPSPEETGNAGPAPTTAPAGDAAGAEAARPEQPTGAAEPAHEGSRRERWLSASRRRFEGDPAKEPITPDQLTYLLDLLHEEGKGRRLVSETYGYLDRGMSKGHASMQIKKLRGEFVERRPAAV